MNKKKSAAQHVCYACGSDKTWFDKKKKIPKWNLNEPTDLVLCGTCYRKILLRPLLRELRKNSTTCHACGITRSDYLGKFCSNPPTDLAML